MKEMQERLDRIKAAEESASAAEEQLAALPITKALRDKIAQLHEQAARKDQNPGR